MNYSAIYSEHSRGRCPDQVFKQATKDHPRSGRRLNLSDDPLSQKMSVANVQAALATWKSIQNQHVNQLSESFRMRRALTLRVSSSAIRSLPS